jgi:hypothetical protein
MPFGTLGYVAYACMVVVALVLIINPHRLFWLLSAGRISLPARLHGFFRVLGVVNLIGSIYQIVRYATGE